MVYWSCQFFYLILIKYRYWVLLGRKMEQLCSESEQTGLVLGIMSESSLRLFRLIPYFKSSFRRWHPSSRLVLSVVANRALRIRKAAARVAFLLIAFAIVTKQAPGRFRKGIQNRILTRHYFECDFIF